MAYALIDLGRERMVARFVGPAEQLAFNESVLRESLASLEADRWWSASRRPSKTAVARRVG